MRLTLPKRNADLAPALSIEQITRFEPGPDSPHLPLGAIALTDRRTDQLLHDFWQGRLAAYRDSHHSIVSGSEVEEVRGYRLVKSSRRGPHAADEPHFGHVLNPTVAGRQWGRGIGLSRGSGWAYLFIDNMKPWDIGGAVYPLPYKDPEMSTLEAFGALSAYCKAAAQWAERKERAFRRTGVMLVSRS